MATIAQNIHLDLTTGKIVRENNPFVLQRDFTFTEGNVYSGNLILWENGVASEKTISAFTVEIGNTANDIALILAVGTDSDVAISFNGILLRQYLYNVLSRQAVISISLTADGTEYVIDALPVELVANPENNVGESVTWDNLQDKPSTFPPSAHTQDWTTVTDKPSTFPPSAHNQGWDTITSKPATITNIDTLLAAKDTTTQVVEVLGNFWPDGDDPVSYDLGDDPEGIVTTLPCIFVFDAGDEWNRDIEVTLPHPTKAGASGRIAIRHKKNDTSNNFTSFVVKNEYGQVIVDSVNAFETAYFEADYGDETTPLAYRRIFLKTNPVHTHLATDISDSTTFGRTLLTAANVAAQQTALSLGTSNDVAFKSLSANNGTITTNQPVLTLGQTWNNAATIFNAVTINVTQTAANTNSNALSYLYNGTSYFRVTRTGGIHSAGGLSYAPGGNAAVIAAQVAAFGASGANNAGGIFFADGNGGALTVKIGYDGSGVLAQRNGTSAQTFRLYNTYTDSTNYERGFMRWNSNVLEIGTEKLGTGSARELRLSTDGTARVSVFSSGRVSIGSTTEITNNGGALLYVRGTGSSVNNWKGRIVAGGDNFAFLMGEFNNQAWLGGHNAALNSWAPFYINPGGNSDLYLGNRAGVAAGSEPLLTLKNSGALVVFGNATASFPALKRSGTELRVRLADDSGYADLRCGKLMFDFIPTQNSLTPTAYGDLAIEATSNTTLTLKLMGTDGTLRTTTLTLS